MTETWRAIEDLFYRVVSLDDAERASLYAEEAAPTWLSQAVEHLVEVDRDAGQPLTRGMEQALGEALGSREETILGEPLGEFRPIARLGQGGQGTVYLAERLEPHLEDRVAIKILDSVARPAGLEARFQQEQSILSSLEHPNIARFLGSGTTRGGQPYLVMEAVEGEPIDVYCRRRALPLEDVLGLFCRAASAVQAAHQRLIIHRDLKPSNLLVTEDGVPKLLDFGIAKLLDPDRSLTVTGPGARPLTPTAASPEQIRGESLTTATDIYSLGLLLFRLLTGEAPYRFTGESLLEAERTICHTEPALASALSGRADLRGDLDAILLKTLQKRPEDRYASVESLVKDIHRFLDKLPVQARPAGFTYLAGKFMRRHRRVLASVAALFLTAVSLTVFFTLRLRAERDQAELARVRAEAVKELMLDFFSNADPNQTAGEDLRVRDVLDRAASRLDAGDGPPIAASVKADLLSMIGRVFRNMSLHERAGAILTEALRIREKDGDDPLALADSHTELGVVSLERGHMQKAAEHFEAALTLRRKLGDRSWKTANLFAHRAELAVGRDPEAVAADIEQSLEIWEQLEDEARGEEQVLAWAGTLDLKADLLWRRGRHREAAGTRLSAIELLTGTVGPDHLKLAEFWNNQAFILRDLGRLEDAEEAIREALRINGKLLGESSVRLGTSWLSLGNLQRKREHFELAAESCGKALEMTRREGGADHANLSRIQICLGRALEGLGRRDEAEAAYLDALRIERLLLGTGGATSWEVSQPLYRLGALYVETGRWQDAETVLRECYERRLPEKGAEDAGTLRAACQLGKALRSLDRPEAADLLAACSP